MKTNTILIELFLLLLLFSEDKDYSALVTAYYSAHNPDKIKNIPKLLEKYKGKEETLLASLKEKYEPVVVSSANVAEASPVATKGNFFDIFTVIIILKYS